MYATWFNVQELKNIARVYNCLLMLVLIINNDRCPERK